MADSRGYALPAGGGREIPFRGTRMHGKGGHAEGAAYALVEMTHPPKVGPAIHRHPGRLAQGPVTMDVEAEIAARYGQDFLDRLRHWGQ
jgi:hypothetical protein